VRRVFSKRKLMLAAALLFVAGVAAATAEESWQSSRERSYSSSLADGASAVPGNDASVVATDPCSGEPVAIESTNTITPANRSDAAGDMQDAESGAPAAGNAAGSDVPDGGAADTPPSGSAGSGQVRPPHDWEQDSSACPGLEAGQ